MIPACPDRSSVTRANNSSRSPAAATSGADGAGKNQGRFAKDQFTLGFAAGQLTRPAGVVMPVEPCKTVRFPKDTCAAGTQRPPAATGAACPSRRGAAEPAGARWSSGKGKVAPARSPAAEHPVGSGPDAVAAQGRLEQVKGPAGGRREHLADLVARLAGQDAPGAFGEQHPVNRGELGRDDPLLRVVCAGLGGRWGRPQPTAAERSGAGAERPGTFQFTATERDAIYAQAAHHAAAAAEHIRFCAHRDPAAVADAAWAAADTLHIAARHR